MLQGRLLNAPLIIHKSHNIYNMSIRQFRLISRIRAGKILGFRPNTGGGQSQTPEQSNRVSILDRYAPNF